MNWNAVYAAQQDDLASALARQQVMAGTQMKVADELQRRKEADRSFGLQEQNATENRKYREMQETNLAADRKSREQDRTTDNERQATATRAANLQRLMTGKRKGEMVTNEDQVELVKGGHVGFAQGAGPDEHSNDPHFDVAGNTALDAADTKEKAALAKADSDLAHQQHAEGNDDVRTKAAMISAMKPSGGAGVSKLTPNQEVTLTNKLRGDYVKANANYNEMKRQNAMMQSGLAMLQDPKQSMNAPTQAIISTFNKILDPTSVVRESEYARSPEGMGILQRLEGIPGRLQKGGIGMTTQELQNFAALGSEFLKNTEASAQRSAAPILAQADRYGIPREFIFSDGPQAQTPAAAPATAAPAPATPTQAGAAPQVGQAKTFPNGKTAVWDGKGWRQQ